jgi:hypothetical protein
MKVFISHKKEDSSQALLLKYAFEENGVEAYLDLLDSSVIGDGKTLTEHIRKQLNSCTDIIVLITDATKYSWWVPFEIGMSAQIDMPTASFLKDDVALPSYLSYWPRLRSISDVERYVSIRKRIASQFRALYHGFELHNRRKEEVNLFYETLKKELR